MSRYMCCRLRTAYCVLHTAYTMFWPNRMSDEILRDARAREKLEAGVVLVVRDEKTMSGKVHVGSLRGVVIHGLIAEVLAERGVPAHFLYEINDFDPMDDIPTSLERARFEPYLGKPLVDIPAPDGVAKNFAEQFATDFTTVIAELGFAPEYCRSSEMYRSGRYNDAIRAVLLGAETIRGIYRTVSGSERREGWLPLHVLCERCGKISTTEASDFDGETVAYHCTREHVEWTEGCDMRGRISPFDGRAKLPWKVEWAAKFSVFDVAVEGAGKDHATKGGARDVADAISREVFRREPPFDIPYEHIIIGGRKMSSSKGVGASARAVADLLPPELLRFLMLAKEPREAIEFNPEGDTIPALFDLFDRYAGHYFEKKDDDYARAFLLSHAPTLRAKFSEVFRPRFSQVAFVVQMPHMDLAREAERLKGAALSPQDNAELDSRAQHAKLWLDQYASEQYRFALAETLPDAAREFASEVRAALRDVLAYAREHETLDGEALHATLHDIRSRHALEPKIFFGALYTIFLNKNYGPKAGWFLSALSRDLLLSRLTGASISAPRI